MTVSYFALYRTPDDPAAFEQHYFGTHVPLIEKTPGLLENRVHRVTRQFVGEPSYHLLAELVFASPEAMKEAFRSPEWAAAGEDLQGVGRHGPGHHVLRRTAPAAQRSSGRLTAEDGHGEGHLPPRHYIPAAHQQEPSARRASA